jgi:hypothetical protein
MWRPFARGPRGLSNPLWHPSGCTLVLRAECGQCLRRVGLSGRKATAPSALPTSPLESRSPPAQRRVRRLVRGLLALRRRRGGGRPCVAVAAGHGSGEGTLFAHVVATLGGPCRGACVPAEGCDRSLGAGNFWLAHSKSHKRPTSVTRGTLIGHLSGLTPRRDRITGRPFVPWNPTCVPQASHEGHLSDTYRV